MATEPASHLDSPSATAAPLGGTRTQAMQRLQVGLFGLMAMVLLVGLASVITAKVEQSEAAVIDAGAAPSASPAADLGNDPLADAGVLPDVPEPASTPIGSRAAER